ncbi:MAG: beta-ketoacyl-[acyl-carrier-protein] synthase II [Planctomycetes bacterium RBG_16_64_12]|nr:MAG: beta-ketoacyl-[acyl-carrier-protein] synthase II [Planctomycetes bacterium RBG_16_64_12]
MRRRVVITGVGCVTPLGIELARVWARLTEGQSGIGPVTLFDASSFPVRIAAEVPDWDISAVGEDPARWEHDARDAQFAIAAAIEAVRAAGLEEAHIEPTRFGVYLGCGEVFPEFFTFSQLMTLALDGERFNLEEFLKHGWETWPSDADQYYEPSTAAARMAGLFNAQGPNINLIAACASSSQAIGEAAELIRSGDADVMLAGGAHSLIHPLGMMGFLRLETLSARNDEPWRAMRPFDRDRDGFVVGEGAAVVVLEASEHARSRGAEIWGELTGYGTAQDAFSLSEPHPQGRGAVTSMQLALADARLNPQDIDYINAHGTSTVVNDKIETLAIKQVFGDEAYRVPISSTKSMMGHFTTAGGAIELVVGLMAARTGVLPPTINYETPDPECDLDYVPNTAREIDCRHVLSNSLGFGGQNAALIVSRFDGKR